MRELWFQRTSVNAGHVVRRNASGVIEHVTGEVSLPDAQKYIFNHQRELTAYKIAYKRNRKNAVRHLFGVRYFATPEEAVAYFETVNLPNCTMQLLTGDWKLLAEKPSDIKNEKEKYDHGTQDK